jgi:ferredoxin-type protein NapF
MSRRHSRRDLLTSWAEVFRGASDEVRSQPRLDPEKVLRPPGALTPDDQFLAACTGCGDCVPACPTKSILTIEHEELTSLPVINPRHKPCYLCTDLPCIAACKEGALVSPGGPDQVRIGIAKVDPRICITFRGEICQSCYKACPFPNLAILMIGSRPLISNSACTGCGLCVQVCPTQPRAITIVPERQLVPGLRIPQEEYHTG